LLYKDAIKSLWRGLLQQTQLQPIVYLQKMKDSFSSLFSSQATGLFDKNLIMKNQFQPLTLLIEVDSVILRTSKNIEMLRKWLNESQPEDVEFKLLYRATGETFATNELRSKCNDQDHLVIIFELMTGEVKGCYITQFLSTDEKQKHISNTFAFDITNKRKYPMGSDILITDMMNGFSIGNSYEIVISQRSFDSVNGSKATVQFNPRLFTTDNKKSKSTFSGAILVENVEVFQIQYPGIKKPEVVKTQLPQLPLLSGSFLPQLPLLSGSFFQPGSLMGSQFEKLDKHDSASDEDSS